jgi:ABC-type sugar transport system ATPase subunit
VARFIGSPAMNFMPCRLEGADRALVVLRPRAVTGPDDAAGDRRPWPCRIPHSKPNAAFEADAACEAAGEMLNIRPATA